MLTLYLHGQLSARYGSRHRLDVQSAHAAITALCAQRHNLASDLANTRLKLIAGDRDTGTPLNGIACFQPLTAKKLHVEPVITGAGKQDGKMVLGLTLIGLSFIPGLNGAIASQFANIGAHAGPQLASASGFLGQHILGSAGIFLMQSALSAPLPPYRPSPAGIDPPGDITAPTSQSEGAPIPLIYGQVTITNPPIISSTLIVETIKS